MLKWNWGLIVAALTCGSCGSTPAAPSLSTYVGAVDGTDVTVGLVSDGTHLALFFCGGPTSYATSTKWFHLSANPASFTASADTWSASGATTTSGASGTVDRGDGNVLTWSASSVDSTNDPVGGLYESVDATGTAGVVVRGTSSTDVQGAFIATQTKAVEQIIPIFPLERTAAGLHVTVGTRDLFVPPAVLP